MGEVGFPGGPIGSVANRLAPGDGAGNGIRTRDTKLGKLVLYQLSYARSTSKFNKFSEKSQELFPERPLPNFLGDTPATGATPLPFRPGSPLTLAA